MQKEVRGKLQVLKRILFVLLLLCCAGIFGAGLQNKTAFAAGPEPFDSRARIGFQAENGNYNKFFIEENGGAVTARVFVNRIQTSDTPFTLTEMPFGGGSPQFVFAAGYVLPAGSAYIDITFYQIAQAESGNGVRLSDIYIRCDTPTVIVGDVEHYGETEPYDDDFLAVVYDKTGATELIVEALPIQSYETDGSVSSRLVRSGVTTAAAEIYYRIKDYTPDNTKELVFENYNSVLNFGANEREKNLQLEFFDNDRLNLRDAYVLEIYSAQGISRVFDLARRRYLLAGEEVSLNFAILDDEPFSDKYAARVQYYQPGEINPTYQITEGNDFFMNVIFDVPGEGGLPSFRLYYTVEPASTAEYGIDYVLGGTYSRESNLGYIDAPQGQSQYFGRVDFIAINDMIFNGTRTVFIKFFVLGRQDILLQPLDTVTVEITDNEFLPENNTVSWTAQGSLNGCAWHNGNVLTIDSSFYGWGEYIIGIDTDYLGNARLTIPVKFEDVTAKNGVDYSQTSAYALLTYRARIGVNKYGIDLNLINDFYFSGTRRLKVTILEEGLSAGLSLAGDAELYIDLVGRVEEGYNYIEYTQSEIDDLFSVGKNETLTFKIKRIETAAGSTYLDMERDGRGLLENTHVPAGFFPYEVVWAQNETEKTITFEFLQNWDDTNSGSGNLLCLDKNKQFFNDTYGENHHTRIPMTLYQSNSAAKYYFQGNPVLTGLTCEYKYSVGALLIEVKRELLSAQSFDSSVDYHLTFDYDPTKNWQIILADDAATIGGHIDNLSGTLYFTGTETTKYIRVTVPDTVSMPYGSKFVNVTLDNPSDKTYILRKWDYDGKFDVAKIKITNDITPFFAYRDLTTITTNADGFETTVINALEFDRKGSDSFGIELVPYNGTPTLSSLYYVTEYTLYSVYDLSSAGVEVWGDGNKLDPAAVTPLRYYYTDGSGSHMVEYRYAYVLQLHINSRNPLVTFTLKYTEISENWRAFLTTSLLLKAQNPYFMNGWDTYDKQLILEACGEDPDIEIEMRSSSVASEGVTDVQAGDTVYITLTRSSAPPGVSTMFFRSVAYIVKSFITAQNASQYYEPLDTQVVFEPYERSKTVAFVTRDGRPQGANWDPVASVAHIKVYDPLEPDEVLDELTVNVHEDWPVTLINAEVVLLNDYVRVHMQSWEDFITIKLLFDKAYDTDISFRLVVHDERIGNLALILPAGETEIIHNLTFNANNFAVSSETVPLAFEGVLDAGFEGSEIRLAVPIGLQVIVSSQAISSRKFRAGVPSATSIDEDSRGYISLDIIADRWQYPQYWKDVLAYVKLGGTAVYGRDYTIKYDGQGSDMPFDPSTGIVVIYKIHDRSTLKIYPKDNGLVEGPKTIELTVLDYHNYHAAYPETFTFTINDNEYLGDVNLVKSQNTALNQTTISITRENHTAINLPLSYEIEEIFGVYGTDFVVSQNGANLGKSGTVTLTGSSSSLTLYVIARTEKGKSAAFNFRIASQANGSFTLKTDEVFVSLRSIGDGGAYAVRTAKTDTALYKWPGNRGYYLLDYTEYYARYTAGAKVKVASQNFAGTTEDLYLDFNPGGLTTLSASGRIGQYAVPSGISLNNWVDINKDGVKELIFVANLDSCFGGASELARTGLCGVYALDLITGEYTQILALEEAWVSHYLDVYLCDLKGDGYPEAVVFCTPWADTALRKNGGNMLFILDNTGGTFALENIYDDKAVVNGTNMTLYSVAVPDKYLGYARNYIEISYYSRTDRYVDAQYGSIIELSAGENARLLYCDGANVGYEGRSFVLRVQNVSGAAGTATLFFRSDDAVYGRDYLPQSVSLTFAQGEYVKEVTLVTLNNSIPTNSLRVYFYLESDDFNVGNKGNYIEVLDASTVNRGVAYTVQSGFDSAYTNADFITGDAALVSLAPLTIDGIRCAAQENGLYDVRLTVRFGNLTWTDENRDGLIALTGLQNIFLSSGEPHYIYADVEFLYEGTQTAFSKKTFSIWYEYFGTDRRYFKVVNDVEITETIYMGKLTIKAKSTVVFPNSQMLQRFSLEYVNTIDNKTYTFYSDKNGMIDAQLNFGNVQGLYTYFYTVTSLSVTSQPYVSEVRDLRAYKETMDFPVTVIDSVRQSLLRDVLIEVEGININFRYSGRSNAETGLFTIPALTPQKTYRITINSDYGISYFQSYTTQITPTVYDPNFSLSLELRTDETSLDNITVAVLNKNQIDTQMGYAANLGYWYSGQYAYLADYLAGAVRTLSQGDEILLSKFYSSMYKSLPRNAKVYRISGDVLFSNDFPNVYKSMVKDPDEVMLIFYRYNPKYDFGTVNVKLSGTTLTAANSYYRQLTITKNNVTDCVSFYALGGAENCIVDIEIQSDAYLNGKKTVQLACFGNGLGAFLLQPIQDMFAAIETAPVPANFAFLNGMSFMLGFADVDFAFDYDEEKNTFSIYMGASKDLYEKSHGMKYGDIGRPTLAQLREAKAAGLGMGRGQAGLGVGLGGKMIFEYVDGEWKLTAGEIYFSVSASYNYTKYILLPVVSIPAFFSATVSLELQTTIYFDWNAAEEYTEVTGDLAIELAVEIECGIGIKGFLSASVYGRAGIQVIIQLESGAAKLTLYVEGGVRIQIIFWKYTYSFGRAEWSTQSDGYIDRDAAMQSLRLSQLSNTTDYSGVAALYNQSGQLVMGIGLGDDGQAQDIVLVSNVYEKSTPKIAELTDGTKMIAWINYDAARGSDNAEVINYIYFDGENWSEVATADDTLTADLDLDIKVINGKFAILCTEVKEELATGATLSERLLKSDVAMLVFDPTTRTFSKTALTNNLFNDRQALFDYEAGNGIAVVYRSENTNITDDMTINDFLCGENADNKLYYCIYDSQTDSWGGFALFNYALPAVSTMSQKIVGGIAYIALECDKDGNFDTTGDREIILLQYIFATGQTRMQQLTDNAVQDVSPSLLKFMDKAFLAYRSGDEVKYWFENNSYTVCALPQNYTNFEMFASGDYAVMLFTMPVEGVSQVFASVMDSESMAFSAPAQVTFSDKPARDPILSFAGSEITVYYCADTYTLLSSEGDEYTFSITSDIARTGFRLYSELAVEVLPFDYAAMRPGEDFTFTVRIYNFGTLNAVSPWLKIYMSESLLTELTAGIVPGNEYLDVPASVRLPSTRGILTFKVGQTSLADCAEVEVLLADLSISKEYNVTWNENGTLTVVFDVTNLGTVDASDITVSVTAYSNPSSRFASAEILLLGAGETKSITMTIAKENVRFNANNELWLKAYALTPDKDIYTVGEDDYNPSDNVRSMRASRPLFADGTTLALLRQSIDLTAGGSGYIDFVYTGDGEIEVTSSDPSIVAANGKQLTTLKRGSATITVSDGDVTKTLLVTVTPRQFSLTFKDSDGTVLRTETLAEGAAITLPTDPSKPGYTFGGWGRAVADIMPGENVTYTAVWVLVVPIITAQNGYSGTFDGYEYLISIEASHPLGDVTYQWYKGEISEATLLEGQTGAALSVKDIADSGTYYCRITYTDGTQVKYTDSAAIEVSITEAKTIFSGGAIAAISVGAVIVVLLAGGLALFLVRKKKGKA